tara:strand:+ start:761 stop:1201 length:441 start_codon:yes stop_codon:yes gene_type:complete
MRILLIISLFLSLPTFADDIVAEPITKGQRAPFNGIILDGPSAAKVISGYEYATEKCKIMAEHDAKKAKANCELEKNVLAARLQSTLEKHRAITKIKEDEILRLQRVLKSVSADYSEWWFVGGVVAGIVTSVAIFYAAVKTSQGDP